MRLVHLLHSVLPYSTEYLVEVDPSAAGLKLAFEFGLCCERLRVWFCSN